MADTPQPPPRDPAGDPRSAAVGSPGDLPLALTSLVGREREVSEVGGLLAGDARLLTLTGPGGTGKTRLAQAVAFEAVEGFEDGVWWVELASVSDPDLVPQAVARVLNVPEAPRRSLTRAIANDLGGLEILLVLDNCEHLVGACAELADALLGACAHLGILATSREALSIAGERNFPVPPLSVPDPERPPPFESLAGYEAVRLFVERAQSVAPAFELTEQNAPAVAKLCRTLDGMPLAIELAAARVRVLSVEQISSRLDDSFTLLAGGNRTAEPRQRTLRAAIDWSYDLLSEEERILFRRLSVFAGGFTLEAAEDVCSGDGLEEGDVLEVLSPLVEKSLVSVVERGGEARFSLLETVRQYGWEKLEQSGEAERVRGRHAEHYLALAEEAEPHLTEQDVWLERLEAEHANFRAALSFSLGSEGAGEPAGESAELGLRLAAALGQGRFWAAYGPTEGFGWLEKGLAAGGASPSSVRAKALSEAGYLAFWRGEIRRVVDLMEEGMTLYEELGDKAGVANSLVNLGQIALHAGDPERARALRPEAEALLSELTDPQAKGLVLYFLGVLALSEGDRDRAAALCGEGLELNRQRGDLRGIAMGLTNLGIIALEQGDAEQAAAQYEENLHVLRRLRDKIGTAYGLRGMAGVAALKGEAGRAARLWGAVEALQEAIGMRLSPLDRAHPDYEGLIEDVRTRSDDDALWEAALAEGRAMDSDKAVEYALETDEPSAPPPDEYPATPPLLSEREAQILALVAEGLTNPQIARQLYLSPRTVGQHLRSVYRKLGVSSRAAAVREASERGLI